MKIRRFDPADVPAIERLNDRLTAGGITHRVYPEGPRDQQPGSVHQRLFVAADDGEIRGGVWLKEHEFLIHGEIVTAGWAKYPVSESLVNPAFGAVGGSLLFHLVREQPRLMALGLGGHETPFARLLQTMRWSGATVPLFVLPLRPRRVLRGLPALRRSRSRQILLDGLALSGLGGLALATHRWIRQRRARFRPAPGTREPIDTSDPSLDRLWERVGPRYPFLSVRDAGHLTSQRHEFGDRGDLQWIQVRAEGTEVGWFSAVRIDFSERPEADPRFGRLTVGMLADVLADPADAPTIVAAAVEFFRARAVDVVFSNQYHAAWRDALHDAGFVPGPSNFAFYCTRTLREAIGDFPHDPALLHVNRGDCDGPVWA